MSVFLWIFMLKSYTIPMKEHLCDTNENRCDVKNIAFDRFHRMQHGRMHQLNSHGAWLRQPNMAGASAVVTAVCHLNSLLFHLQCIDSVMNRTNRMWN